MVFERSGRLVMGECASLDLGEGNVGIPLVPLEFQFLQAEDLKRRERLSRPARIVELVERDDRSPGHARNESLQRRPGGFVEIAVDEKKADQEVRVRLNERGCCL